jgi:cytochrome P450
MPLERVVPEEGLTLGRVRLPAGTIVGMNAWVIHRDKKVYGENADAFHPERWVDAGPAELRTMEKSLLSVSNPPGLKFYVYLCLT